MLTGDRRDGGPNCSSYLPVAVADAPVMLLTTRILEGLVVTGKTAWFPEVSNPAPAVLFSHRRSTR